MGFGRWAQDTWVARGLGSPENGHRRTGTPPSRRRLCPRPRGPAPTPGRLGSAAPAKGRACAGRGVPAPPARAFSPAVAVSQCCPCFSSPGHTEKPREPPAGSLAAAPTPSPGRRHPHSSGSAVGQRCSRLLKAPVPGAVASGGPARSARPKGMLGASERRGRGHGVGDTCTQGQPSGPVGPSGSEHLVGTCRVTLPHLRGTRPGTSLAVCASGAGGGHGPRGL